MDTQTEPTNTLPETAPIAEQPAPKMMRIRRGRHPDVTPGAFGNGRKHNGIKFRKSALISRFR